LNFVYSFSAIPAIQHIHCIGWHRELDEAGQVSDHVRGRYNPTELLTLQTRENQSSP